MRKIIIEAMVPELPPLLMNEVILNKPVFVKRDGNLYGMVVKDPSGWIVRTGGETGAYGYYLTLQALIEAGIKARYEFYQ